MKIFRFDKILNRPLRYFLGFALVSAWVKLLNSNSALQMSPNTALSQEIILLESTFGVLLLCALVIVFATRLALLSRHRETLHLVGLIGAVATAMIPVINAGLIDSGWFALSALLAATCSIWLSFAWYELFATQKVHGGLICLCASTILGIAAGYLISLLPSVATVICAVLLPVLTPFTLRPTLPLAVAAPDGHVLHPNDTLEGLVWQPDSTPDYSSLNTLLKALPLRLILTLVIISVTFGIVRALGVSDEGRLSPPLADIVDFSANILAFLVAGILAFSAYRMNIVLAFFISFFFIALTALLILAPIMFPASLLTTTAAMGVNLVRLLIWLLMVRAIVDKSVPAIPCFALLCGAEFLGTFIGQLFSLAVDKNPVVLAVFLLLMVIAAAMVLMGSRLYLAQPVPATISLDERVVALGSRCNLSPREQEIMLIWLTGHNSSYIEKKLTISKNTVKTHLSHIYAKTNTANKEELLALVSPPEEGQ